LADNGILRIEVPTPFRVGAVNVYLLEGSPLTLVDTGPLWPNSVAALEQSLAARGHRVEDIELVVLTHQHYDHVGLAETIRARSGARIAGLTLLAEYLDAYPDSAAAEDAFAVDVMRHYGTAENNVAAIRDISKSFWRYAERVKVDLTLADGDEFEAGGRLLRARTRPGHSPTDTVFVDEAHGVAFVGDHLLTRISSNPVIHRPVGRPPDMTERDATLAVYLDSLRRTADLDLAEIMPGHGDPRAEPNELIGLRIAHHEERKETIADLIEGGRRTVPELAASLWGDLADSEIYLAVSEVVGHTDLLVAESRLVEREHEDSVVFEPL
jgi:glyoxylase-like metal-dependent hydrolase (beta-lactamase superfamily II)